MLAMYIDHFLYVMKTRARQTRSFTLSIIEFSPHSGHWTAMPLSLYAFGELTSPLNELWMVFDTGNHYKTNAQMEQIEGSRTLCGVASLKPAYCVENCCAAVAPKAVTQTARA